MSDGINEAAFRHAAQDRAFAREVVQQTLTKLIGLSERAGEGEVVKLLLTAKIDIGRLEEEG